MSTIFGVPPAAFMSQLLLGLTNGSFYAILSLGLAVIFGLLGIVNFAHGAMYMAGAFVTWMALAYAGLSYWSMLLLAPLCVGAFGMLVERFLLRHLYRLDPTYGMLLTFGVTLLCEGGFRWVYGVSGQPYQVPDLLKGATNVGFMIVPNYRAWVVVASLGVCAATWFVIERTRLGSYLRAGTENPRLVQAFGVNVPLLITLTYGFGVALAAFAGVLAAPVLHVNPLMGSNLIIVVFAVVVIGGMGSIGGAVVAGIGLGVVEGITKVYYPQAANLVIFVVMALVLLTMPAGLFGKSIDAMLNESLATSRSGPFGIRREMSHLQYIAVLALFVFLPLLGTYPLFLMKGICLALFACAFNLLLGYGGLLSFGHAAFFGLAAYVMGHALKVFGWSVAAAMPAAVVSAAALGLLFGWLSIKRNGVYFSMVTLALSQMVYFVCVQAPFTGGEDGLQGVPRGHLLGFALSDDLTLYYWVLAIAAGAFWLVYRCVNSPFGDVVRAVRDNELRAISLGHDAQRYKLLVFVMSAALSGLAGALKTEVLGFATLSDVFWTTSGVVILMTIVGGAGTMLGPLVGAFVVVTIEDRLGDLGHLIGRLTGVEMFDSLGEAVSIVTGLIFIICVLLFRRGIVGTIEARHSAIRRRGTV